MAFSLAFGVTETGGAGGASAGAGGATGGFVVPLPKRASTTTRTRSTSGAFLLEMDTPATCGGGREGIGRQFKIRCVPTLLAPFPVRLALSAALGHRAASAALSVALCHQAVRAVRPSAGDPDLGPWSAAR